MSTGGNPDFPQCVESWVVSINLLDTNTCSSFYQREDTGRSIKDCWDSPDAPALSTCSNADIFRRINAMLDNSLDFSGVCTTPVTKSKRDILPGDVFGWV